MGEKKERLASAIAKEDIDRPPVTLWRHNFLREWSAGDLADETIDLYRRFDWDLIKLNPRWSYFPEAWGNIYEPPTEQRFQAEISRVVREARDLDAIEPADPNHPALREQLDALQRVVREVGDEVDVIHTVFSPLAVVGLIAGGIGPPLVSYAEENPRGLERALGAVCATISGHIQDALDRGAAGFFFAPLQWTSLDVCNASLYERFGRPYDLQVLEAAEGAKLNALHVCGNEIGMERFLDYPVDVLSWDDGGKGNPSLVEVAAKTDRAVMGGIPHKRIHKMTPPDLLNSVEESVGQLETGFILAGGCAVGALLDDASMRGVRDLAGNL
ncbi:MAG: uroporphyrinogen decarboxylase family protein [Myxococcota bacterium]|nr:uroporphyrinogen decarboxylase family protein [Myxococcota bacterium]